MLTNLTKFAKTHEPMNENAFRIGHGYDVHALRAGLPLILCGVRIESDRGFVAHSDGDVAIHALCDALLGAAALGDIGQRFPDTDPQWKGIDSRILLEKVIKLIGAKGYVLGNADITIALQAPKIGKYVPAMRESLAKATGVNVSRISVKATTTERLGFVGREEGCEVWATVLIRKS
jgi:2-C-methyl-D-erythritol 2,4-cyclodiphosphate synthase